VASAFGIETPVPNAASSVPAPRPPALCPGCPHGDTCNALNAVLKSGDAIGKLFSDIGCYTLSAMPPYESVDTCVEMGASITMAKGASQAGLHPSVALIGDSTFTHSGMTGLLDCVNEDANVTVVIVDNLTIAMTGGQKSSANNRLADICVGLGVDPDHIRIITPLPNKHDENVAVLQQEIAHTGPSVVIAVRECIQTARRSRSKGGSS
jgi:indolepyruvate ferredoxin oxidoreductase, alpha subunit